MTSRPGHGPPGPSRGAPPARASSRAASSTSAFSRARAAAPDHPLGSHLARRPPASTASSSDAQALRGPRAMASTARTTSQPFGPAASEADTETEGDTVDEEDDDASDSVSTNFDHMDVDIDPNVDWDHVSNPSVTSTRGAVTQDSQGRPPMGAARMASLAKAYALQDDELDEDLTRENYARSRTERLKALYDRHRSAQSDASTELRDALQGRLNEAVRSLDRDRWMFEPEDDEH